MQNSIEIPPSHRLLQQADFGLDDANRTVEAYNVSVLKHSQTPSTKNAKADAATFQGHRYREWQDVDKCLKASLESNYQDLLAADQVKRSENNSCFARNRGMARSKLGLGSRPRVRFAEARQDTLEALPERPGQSTAMALLQCSDAGTGAPTSPPVSSFFEMQKIYYSHLNVSTKEAKKKGQRRYQQTMQPTPNAAAFRRAADVASSLDRRQLQRPRAVQSMAGTMQPPSPQNSKLPRLPSIGTRSGFPFQ